MNRIMLSTLAAAAVIGASGGVAMAMTGGHDPAPSARSPHTTHVVTTPTTKTPPAQTTTPVRPPTQTTRTTRPTQTTPPAQSTQGTQGTQVMFGPEGYDGIRLGMTVAQVRAAGGSVTKLGGDSECMGLHLPGKRVTADSLDGYVTADQGVVYIVTSDRNVDTPEGMHVGSTEAQADTAYPDSHKAPDFIAAPVPGHAGTSYWWGYRHGKVGALTLVRDAHTCVN